MLPALPLKIVDGKTGGREAVHHAASVSRRRETRIRRLLFRQTRHCATCERSTRTWRPKAFGLVLLRSRPAAQRQPPPPAPRAADPAELQAGHGRTAEEARGRRLADDPAHLRRLGLQPARSDHAGQRRAAAAGVGVLDRRDQRPRGAADRQRRRDVRRDAGQPGDRARREDRRAALALPAAAARGRRRCCIRRAAASRCTATRSSSPRAKRCSSRSMRATGKEVWTTTVEDNKNGYYMSLAPLVADGKVMVGASGGELGVRGFVAAFDARDRQGGVEDLHGAGAGRAGQRDVAEGRSVEDRRRIGLGDRQLRSRRRTSRSGAPATAARGWAISGPATTSTPRRRSRSTSPPARSRATFNTTRTIRGTGTKCRRRSSSTTSATAGRSRA